MPARVRLDVAIDGIMSAIVAKLEAATAAGELLEEVETIVRGDRSRPNPPEPAIWIFPEQAANEHETATIAETWTFPVVLTPIIKERTDPEVGYTAATRLAARARSVLLSDRSLGLRDYVQDVYSDRFEASAPWHHRETLYSAVATVVVKFSILEDVI